MSEMSENCAYCEMDTAGNHAFGCPNRSSNPISGVAGCMNCADLTAKLKAAEEENKQLNRKIEGRGEIVKQNVLLKAELKAAVDALENLDFQSGCSWCEKNTAVRDEADQILSQIKSDKPRKETEQ